LHRMRGHPVGVHGCGTACLLTCLWGEIHLLSEVISVVSLQQEKLSLN
jgi:hypothetical protein